MKKLSKKQIAKYVSEWIHLLDPETVSHVAYKSSLSVRAQLELGGVPILDKFKELKRLIDILRYGYLDVSNGYRKLAYIEGMAYVSGDFFKKFYSKFFTEEKYTYETVNEKGETVTNTSTRTVPVGYNIRGENEHYVYNRYHTEYNDEGKPIEIYDKDVYWSEYQQKFLTGFNYGRFDILENGTEHQVIPSRCFVGSFYKGETEGLEFEDEYKKYIDELPLFKFYCYIGDIRTTEARNWLEARHQHGNIYGKTINDSDVPVTDLHLYMLTDYEYMGGSKDLSVVGAKAFIRKTDTGEIMVGYVYLLNKYLPIEKDGKVIEPDVTHLFGDLHNRSTYVDFTNSIAMNMRVLDYSNFYGSKELKYTTDFNTVDKVIDKKKAIEDFVEEYKEYVDLLLVNDPKTNKNIGIMAHQSDVDSEDEEEEDTEDDNDYNDEDDDNTNEENNL